MPKTNADNTQKKLNIGDLLVSEGYVTRSKLNEVLAQQKIHENYLPLGQLCVELGLLSDTELSFILKAHKYKLYLGELLVNMALITPSELDQALREQKANGKKLGDLLVTKGMISEDQLIHALSIQLDIPKIIPDINLIDKSLAFQVKEVFLRNVQAIPAFKQDSNVTVIMADPLSNSTIRDLNAVFHCQIKPAVATRSSIQETLNKLYQQAESADQQDVFVNKFTSLIIGESEISNNQKDVVNVINYLISSAVAEGASDIHIEPLSSRLRVRYRIDGILIHKTDLPEALAASIVSRIKALSNMDIAEKRKHQDGRIQARIHGKDVDLRVSVYASIHGETVTVRILHRATTLINLDNLGFSPTALAKYKRILEYPSGLIMVTGPTGSGKTTTLYASLNYLNKLNHKIITVEDPVEYTIEGVIQGKIDDKRDLTYEDFLKAMMRQDPDVIMVGEIRDHTAAAATVHAALTGHKVFTTFHTDDTTGALLRLMDMGVETFLISSTVVSVLSQRLIRKLCPHCKEQYQPDQNSLDSFNIKEINPSEFWFHRAVGCVHCLQTGYKGRMAIQEFLLVSDSIRNAILSRKTSSQIRNIARESNNMISMLEDGFYKAAKGFTTIEEVLRVVYHNEADADMTRSAGEIIALLEEPDRKDESRQLGDAKDIPSSVNSKHPEKTDNRKVA